MFQALAAAAIPGIVDSVFGGGNNSDKANNEAPNSGNVEIENVENLTINTGGEGAGSDSPVKESPLASSTGSGTDKYQQGNQQGSNGGGFNLTVGFNQPSNHQPAPAHA